MAADPFELLDNPIWHALQTGDRDHSWGNELVKGIDRQMGAFVGMADRSDAAWRSLSEWAQPDSIIVLFTPDRLSVPKGWNISLEKVLVQMVHSGNEPAPNGNVGVIPLGEEHIPAMLSLTHLTKPGPFLKRTIDFGNYEGIFEKGELVSMAGQRFKPGLFTEVSAVCTHPNALGKGYARSLVERQIQKILTAGRTPFLHVYPDNTGAVSLYRKLGFEIRKELVVYVLQKVKG